MPLPGPFSAQIQRALRAVGLIPGGGSGSSFAPFIGNTGVRFTPGGRITQVRVPLANPASTDFVFQSLGPIPAGLMANDGDVLTVYARYTLSAAASTKTYSLNVGYTATGVAGFTGGTGIYSGGTATTSNDLDVVAYVLRLGAGSTAYWSASQFVTSGACQGTLYVTTAGINWAIAQNIGLGIKDGSSNAAAVTMQYAEVNYYPALVA